MPFIRTSDVGKVHISNHFKSTNDYVNKKAIEEKRLKLFKKGTILFPKSCASTFLNHRVMLVIDSYVSSHLATIKSDEEKIIPNFLFQLLCKIDAKNLTENQNYPSLRLKDIEQIKIPLPPLEIQKEIVAEIEGYQKIIDGAKAVVENYKPHIQIDPEWEMVELSEYCDFKRGPFGGSLKKEIFVKKGYLVYEQYHAINDDFTFGRYFITQEKYKEMIKFKVQCGDLLISCSGTMGRISIIPDNAREGIINQALLRLRPLENVIGKFVKYYLESDEIQEKFFRDQSGVAIQNVASVKILKKIPFPKLPISFQQEIVARIEKEQELVNTNKELIEIFEQKIKDRIVRVWGE